MHLRTLEKQRDEYLQEQQELSDQRITIEKKNNPSVDSHVKSYKLGYQACCHDIGRFLDEPALHLTKERLMEYLNKRKEKTLQPSQENGDDPVVVNLITPTRLLDGRLALIFSSSCSWLTRETDLSTPSYTSSSSLSSLHSNSEPTTPPSSPDQKIVQRQLTADLNVWRPWFWSLPFSSWIHFSNCNLMRSSVNYVLLITAHVITKVQK